MNYVEGRRGKGEGNYPVKTMCLGVPMKVISKKGDKAEVKSDRTSREISIGLLRDVKIGDYVIVHAGFAIEKINEKRAKETLEILRKIQL